MKGNIAVLGGDLRQLHLARLLQEDEWNVMTWGLEQADAPCAVSLDDALQAEYIVLPLPICRGERLNLPLTDHTISCEKLWKRLRPKQILLGGMISSLPPALRNDPRFTLLDYYDREEVQIYNAVPTAEGAILRAMEKTNYTLQGSRCLVVGYGRIGKVLAHNLHSLGAEVTVSARKRSDMAWIAVYGYHAVPTENLVEHIGRYDIIFNTVPAMVLDAECLAKTKPNCLLVELASLPGGIDVEAVKAYGLQMIVERGLPGVVAPKTSAEVIRDAIYHILKEQGERA